MESMPLHWYATWIFIAIIRKQNAYMVFFLFVSSFVLLLVRYCFQLWQSSRCEVMRARNRTTLLIIIKCCSVSFILTANVYTVSTLSVSLSLCHSMCILYVQQQWQSCDKAIHFTVVVLFVFFFLCAAFTFARLGANRN